MTANNSRSRSELLRRINEISFTVVELNEYLNTHPDDSEALAYFMECSKRRNHLLREFARLYGPLTIDTAIESSGECWNWIHAPWPWQEGGC